MFNNENRIFNIASENEFSELSLSIFNFQATQNPFYRQWIELLKIDPKRVLTLDQIPFLPIEFFKKNEVVSSPITQNTVKFTSSSTTSQLPSTHFVNDIGVYESSFLNGFELFYGKPSEYCILALLPNYLQRKGSSLVYMCDRLIKDSKHILSGFFLDDIDKLIGIIEELKKTKQKVILIGVSYALMDLCDKGIHLGENFIVMETGGMKGTREELLKPELHSYLKSGFKINIIHSEYGMTELLSQAYSLGNEEFLAPPWMKFLIREVDDPLKIRTDHKTGGINVIDLANVNSCSFIATKDLGKINSNGKLELMGRYDNSDVRGCNLMFGSF
ncbi:MAG: acyl transferase [Bacteroidia bacterium]|nr:acyl transferase [Bacteroidia bacterium]